MGGGAHVGPWGTPWRVCLVGQLQRHSGLQRRMVELVQGRGGAGWGGGCSRREGNERGRVGWRDSWKIAAMESQNGFSPGFPNRATDLWPYHLLDLSVPVCRMGVLMLGDKETQMRALRPSCRITVEEGDTPTCKLAAPSTAAPPAPSWYDPGAPQTQGLCIGCSLCLELCSSR